MRKNRKLKVGTVVSDSMNKTIVVRVDSRKIHPKYKKVFNTSKKFHAHDEKEEAQVGDLVTIMETRPMSKTKNWRLLEINKKVNKQEQEFTAKLAGENK